MNDVQLHVITDEGVRPWPTPGATGFDDLYDDFELGVYSALRTFEHHKFLCLKEHMDRTERSMALLGWSYDWDRMRLRRALHEVCTAYPLPEARVRFDILAEPIRVGKTQSRELIGLMPFTPIPPRLYEEGVRVGIADGLARHNPLAKTADFALARRAYKRGETNGVYEYLLVNEAGQLLEGTGTNFYGVRDGVVWTAGEGMLAGITRRIILGLLPSLDIPLRLEPVTVSEIGLLDEAAISGSSRALLPVVQIGDEVVGDGRPGPICRRVLDAYRAYVAREIKPAV